MQPHKDYRVRSSIRKEVVLKVKYIHKICTESIGDSLTKI